MSSILYVIISAAAWKDFRVACDSAILEETELTFGVTDLV